MTVQLSGPGDALRQAREQRGLSLADAERETRIRIEFLTALEQNDFASLPGDVYTRGFLRNYGAYLGLNAAEVVAAYDGRHDPPRKRTKPGAAPPPPPHRKPEPIRIQPLSPTRVSTRVRYAPSFWLMGLLAFVLLIVGYLGYNAYNGATRQALPTPTPPSRLLTPTALNAFLPTVIVGNTPIWTPFPTPLGNNVAARLNTPPPTPAGSAQVPVTPAGPGGMPGANPAPTGLAGGPAAGATLTVPSSLPGNGVTVQLSVGSQNAWVRVNLDGSTNFQGTLPAGSSRSWSAQNVVRIRFARGDITSVNVNGVDKGLASDSAQTVVTKEWDAAGNERVIP